VTGTAGSEAAASGKLCESENDGSEEKRKGAFCKTFGDDYGPGLSPSAVVAQKNLDWIKPNVRQAERVDPIRLHGPS
jgi:hypothetical protein